MGNGKGKRETSLDSHVSHFPFPISRFNASTPREQLRPGEEKPAFAFGILVRVASVNGVSFLGLSVQLSNGAVGRFFRIGGANRITQGCDGVPVVREGRVAGYLSRGDIIRKLIGS